MPGFPDVDGLELRDMARGDRIENLTSPNDADRLIDRSESLSGRIAGGKSVCRRRIYRWTVAIGGILCLLPLIAAVMSTTHNVPPTKISSGVLQTLGVGESCERNGGVRGLDACPDLKSIMPLLLQNKRRLLRLALDAVQGACSARRRVLSYLPPPIVLWARSAPARGDCFCLRRAKAC